MLYVDKNDRIIILYENNLTEDLQSIKEKINSLCKNILAEVLKKFPE
ncbi:hypothetical protein [Clostridium moutaii]